jgi:DNA-binding NarL/FixJ family response regulator
MSIRIILADDHTIVRDGLSELLRRESDMEVIAYADNGFVAVRLAKELQPDVVIMDVAMPDLNGIEATHQITRDCPNVKVVALSMYSGRRFVSEMLRAGAAGYLLKDCAFNELAAAIRVVVAGKAYLSPSISQVLVENYVRNAPQQTNSVWSALTTREREVLQMLAEGRTTKQIAKLMHISPKTVETHRLKLMGKLKMDSIARLTKYAVQEGLTLPEP